MTEVLTNEERSHTHSMARELFPYLGTVHRLYTSVQFIKGTQTKEWISIPLRLIPCFYLSAWKVPVHPLSPSPRTTPPKVFPACSGAPPPRTCKPPHFLPSTCFTLGGAFKVPPAWECLKGRGCVQLYTPRDPWVPGSAD